MPMNDNTAARRDSFDDIEYGDVVGVAADLRGEPRPAEGRQELWAASGLVVLTGSCDGAVTEDGVGFNKSDTNGGRYLGYYVGAGGMLDDVEWEAAIAMLGKYHGQIGSKPPPDEHDLARRDRVMLVDEDEGFRARLDAILDEARRIQKERAAAARELERRIQNPDVIIGREGADRPDGGVLTVKVMKRVSYDVFEARRAAWAALHAEHGGRWDGLRTLRIVPYRAARALNALLEAHHDGEVCRGTTGKVYVVKHNIMLHDPNAPVDEDEDEADDEAVEEDEDEADDEAVEAAPPAPTPPAPVVEAAPAPVVEAAPAPVVEAAPAPAPTPPAPVVEARGDGGEYAALVTAIRNAPNEQASLVTIWSRHAPSCVPCAGDGIARGSVSLTNERGDGRASCSTTPRTTRLERNMKVKVFGPNLSAAAQRLGQFHVHAADCADCKQYGSRRKFGGDGDAHVLDTESKVRVVRFIYADIIAEDEGSDPLDYLSEFHFAPCCDFLPDVVDVAAAKAHAKLMQESAAAFDAEFIAKPAGEAAPAAVDAPAAPAVEASRLTLVRHPLDAALAALAEIEANVGKVNAGHERHFPLYVSGLRAYIEALRVDLDDDNAANRRVRT